MLFYLIIQIILLIQIILINSTKMNECNKIYYSNVQKIMIRNERPVNKIVVDNMLKKMSIRSGVSPAIIRNCAKKNELILF